MRKARTPEELGFDRHDGQRLRNALRSAGDVRHYRRLQAVLLRAQGHSPGQVARMADCTPWALGRWVGCYLRRHAPEDLRDAPRSGRPPVAPAVTDEAILREFARDPMALGYNSTQWTVPLLSTHLARAYEQPISRRTLRRRLRQLGLVWKRPRYVFSEKDPREGPKKGG